MSRGGRILIIGAMLASSVWTRSAPAEITSIAGSARVSLQELVSGSPGDSDVAFDEFPGTVSSLPVQVVAFLVPNDPNVPAAAAGAAQFADPTELNQPNPEEFAINMALSSLDPHTSYEAEALSEELRGVLFSDGEIDALSREGDEETLFGRLFLDGALAILSEGSALDLTGGVVTLKVMVFKRVEGQEEEVVFSGAVEMTGAPDGQVEIAAQGGFPTSRLVLTDLSDITLEFGAFNALILPNLEIDYAYDATVGEPFTLRAMVQVDASNVPGVGVAAVIGTPTDALEEVISVTQSVEVASKVINALEKERDDPTGTLVFPEQQPLPGLFGLCGLFGFESVAGLAALSGVAFVRRGRSAGRRP